MRIVECNATLLLFTLFEPTKEIALCGVEENHQHGSQTGVSRPSALQRVACGDKNMVQDLNSRVSSPMDFDRLALGYREVLTRDLAPGNSSMFHYVMPCKTPQPRDSAAAIAIAVAITHNCRLEERTTP
jgi:hypothetical protein